MVDIYLVQPPINTSDVVLRDPTAPAACSRTILAAPAIAVVVGRVATIVAWSFTVDPAQVLVTAQVENIKFSFLYIEPSPATIDIFAGVSGITLILKADIGLLSVEASTGVICFAAVSPTASIDILPATSSVISIAPAIDAVRKYECILSGGGVAETVSVPMSAFNSRQRAGDPSYSEVTIPGMDYLEDILDRQTGTFTVAVLIVKSGVVLQREILFESEITSVSISGNTSDQQVMLSGYRTSDAASVPAVVPVSGVSYRSLDRGVTTLRKPEPDLYLRPGDTVQYAGDDFMVGLITFSYSAIYGSSMEIREDG